MDSVEYTCKYKKQFEFKGEKRNNMNIGVIGSGSIATTVINSLRTIPDINVIGVYSRNIENARQLSKQFSINYFTDSIEHLCTREEIDVIYIATPHIFHKDHCLQALSFNKHVLCEKPLTINAEDTKMLSEIAKKNKLFLGEAFWTNFNPVFKSLQEINQSGIIGDFKSLITNIGGNSLNTARLVDKNMGGGALMDIGIYNINLMHELFGKHYLSTASTWIKGESGVDLQHNLSFTYASGVSTSLSATIQAKTLNGALISASQGYIEIDHVSEFNQLVVYNNQREIIKTIKKEESMSGYEYEFIQLKNCLKEGKIEFDDMPLSKTLDILELTDKIRTDWNLEFP